MPVEERMLCASAVLDKNDFTLFLQQIVSTFCTERKSVARDAAKTSRVVRGELTTFRQADAGPRLGILDI